MSVSFYGPAGSHGSLDLNNGLASRLLRAIGYQVSEESSGEMPLDQVEAGILKAQGTVTAEDSPYLGYLSELVQKIRAAGETTLTWS